MDTKKEETEPSAPRFEFRIFGQNFDHFAKRMARLSVPVPEKIWERQSDEIYILSKANDNSSVKIRDGKIDIKKLVNTLEGFEQWDPILKATFPVKAELLSNTIFPAFNVNYPQPNKDDYSYEEFIDLIKTFPDLLAVNIHKQRFAYMVNNTICEVAKVLINGAELTTMSSESTEIEDIKKTISDVGLEGIENVNYLKALKRVVGMVK
ncbi:hypothetical protein [Pedobacter arcticus]|uniref:hypothetical protein n=1 Tax=Pedobacter arcticus TaxID=752140 RepID=UPI0002E50D22|nr:hypothetical protein [Pedobacter arcticus]